MKSPLKMLVAAGPVVSLGFCLAALLLWLRSYEAYPAAALATGGRTWHAGARRGEVWLTCASGWANAADARRAAQTARAARPLVVGLRRFDQFDQANRDLVAHAAFLTTGSTGRVGRFHAQCPRCDGVNSIASRANAAVERLMRVSAAQPAFQRAVAIR